MTVTITQPKRWSDGRRRLPLMTHRLRVGVFVSCSLAFCIPLSALPQERTPSSESVQVSTAAEPTPDFEVSFDPEGRMLFRRRGSLAWTPISELTELATVGSVDGDKVYLVTPRLVKPPKAKRMPDPEYPESELRSHREGRVLLHIIVDRQGAVRLPAADASTGPEFTESALRTVKGWKFKPATLNGQPVAVLVPVAIAFRQP